MSKTVFLLQNMIHTSYVVLSPGLQYHEMSRGSGVQTVHLSWAGPVSDLLGGVILAGYFCTVLNESTF